MIRVNIWDCKLWLGPGLTPGWDYIFNLPFPHSSRWTFFVNVFINEFSVTYRKNTNENVSRSRRGKSHCHTESGKHSLHPQARVMSCSTCRSSHELQGLGVKIIRAIDQGLACCCFQSISGIQLFVTAWTAGFSVLHQLPEYAKACVHWVGDAIQPSHPLSPPSPPALNLSQHQGLLQSLLFTSGGQRTRVSASALVLPVNIQGWFLLEMTCLISLRSKGLSRVFSSTTVWKYQFSALSFLYGPPLTSVHDYWKNYSFG